MQTQQRPRQSGFAKIAGLAVVGAIVFVGLIVAGIFVGRFNKLVTGQETIEAAWSEIDNQCKRRFDLIP